MTQYWGRGVGGAQDTFSYQLIIILKILWGGGGGGTCPPFSAVPEYVLSIPVLRINIERSLTPFQQVEMVDKKNWIQYLENCNFAEASTNEYN